MIVDLLIIDLLAPQDALYLMGQRSNDRKSPVQISYPVIANMSA